MKRADVQKYEAVKKILNRRTVLNDQLGKRFEREVAAVLPTAIADIVPLKVEPADVQAEPWADLTFYLRGQGIDRTLWVEAKGRTLLSRDVSALVEQRERFHRQNPEDVFLVVAKMIPDPLRRQMRSSGLNHADLSGTIYIAAPGLVVRADGPSEPAPASVLSSGANPFSDKASLVLRTLLQTPNRTFRVRDLADQARISPSLVSMVTTELVERGYTEADGTGIRLRDAAGALLDWLAVADWGKSKLRSFTVPFDTEEIEKSVIPLLMQQVESPIALTQLSALDRYAPHVQHPGQYHVAVAASGWDRICEVAEEHVFGQPVSEGGNLHLVLPHAKHSAFFDKRMIDGLPVVSPVQLFLDLSGYSLRGREAAQMLLRTVLARELNLTKEQVNRVLAALE